MGSLRARAGGSSSIWFKQLRAYREHFNVLLLDLRGHGQSHKLQQVIKGHYSFRAVTEDILQLLDHLNIRRAHFVGISLGTILIRHLAELCPERVKSMVLGGAILRLDIRSRVLVQLGRLGQHILPYMWLYRLFAFIIMPRQHHQESRNLFVREARKLCQKEFKRWFRLATEVNPLMRYFKERALPIPTLYVMGRRITCSWRRYASRWRATPTAGSRSSTAAATSATWSGPSTSTASHWPFSPPSPAELAPAADLMRPWWLEPARSCQVLAANHRVLVHYYPAG